jgi:hypothetical protein
MVFALVCVGFLLEWGRPTAHLSLLQILRTWQSDLVLTAPLSMQAHSSGSVSPPPSSFSSENRKRASRQITERNSSGGLGDLHACCGCAKSLC